MEQLQLITVTVTNTVTSIVTVDGTGTNTVTSVVTVDETGTYTVTIWRQHIHTSENLADWDWKHPTSEERNRKGMMKESRKRNTRELTLCRVISDFRHCYHFRYPVKRTNTSNRGNKISGSDYDKFFSHFHLNFVYKLMKQAPRQKKKARLRNAFSIMNSFTAR